MYQKIYPNAKVICGDITDLEVFHQIVDSSPKHIDFLLASPPCQGMSVAGKNRNEKTMSNDKRNYLILYVIDMIKIKNPDYILIENVPALLKLKIHYQNQMMGVLEILNYEFSNDYEIVGEIVDSADYGVPQTRLRAIIRMNKRGKIWKMPSKVSKKVSVAETIGHLPSLESGQSSDIQWHFARSHSPENILWMKHTPTGKSAFNNEIHFPKNQMVLASKDMSHLIVESIGINLHLQLQLEMIALLLKEMFILAEKKRITLILMLVF